MLDQASIAKVAKIEIRRSTPEPSAPGRKFGFAQGVFERVLALNTLMDSNRVEELASVGTVL